jgi:hypothetical protein
VRLALEGPRFTPSLRASVLQQITADLAPLGLGVCSDPQGEPAVKLRISVVGGALAIELQDEGSHERFAREMSLAGVPEDALGLSIAAAAEELLRASLAQNAAARSASAASAAIVPPPSPPLRDTPPAPPAAGPPPAKAPSADRPAVGEAPTDHESPRRPSPPLAARLALLGVAETATEGAPAGGADVDFTWGGRATLGVRAGFRLAPDTPSSHGTVGMCEGILRATAAMALVPRDAPWGAEAVLFGDARLVAFEGAASSAAQALRGSALGVVLGGGVGGWARMARSWSLVGEATGGSAIRGATASDSGAVVTGIRGMVIGFALGVATRL